LYWWHKEPLQATDWFKKTFPKRHAYVMKHKNKKTHYKLHDYIDMYEAFKQVAKQAGVI
jgi:hypothetical protein